jgi:hypothetical protein
MIVAPNGIGQRNFERRWWPRHTAPLMNHLKLQAPYGQPPSAKPSQHLQHQAMRAGQQLVGHFDAVKDFDLRAERLGRFEPGMHFARGIVCGIEKVERRTTTTTLQARPRKSSQVSYGRTTDAIKPCLEGPT